MRKREEVADPESCWNRARDGEFVFVLLGRDRSAAETIRWWVARRVALGLNLHGDPQTVEALALADEIERGCGR